MGVVQSQEELGQRVKQARLARTLDRAALAEAAGLDRTAVSKIESGARKVPALELTRIAAALKLTVPDLVFVPSTAVLSARSPLLAEMASRQEGTRFDAETALDGLMRDAEQLRELGYLSSGRELGPVRWTVEADAYGLAARARTHLGIGATAPIGPIADVCARFGFWIAGVDAAVDGLSVTPEAGFGVAVVGGGVDPGRRRATAAHELGHHLSGDEYSSDVSVSASTDERERLIDAFAAEFLLPATACAGRLKGVVGDDARLELVRVCAEYRVSWSLALRVLRRAGDERTFGDAPTDGDFLEACGSKPEADLTVRTMAGSWVQACMAALRAGAVTAVRAAEMMRTSVTAGELR